MRIIVKRPHNIRESFIKDQFADLYETVRAKSEISTIPVKVRRLDTILATHEPDLRAIDILAIDVEGWELNVMRGLTRYQPDVVILENNFDSAEYAAFMTARGYRRWRRLEPNDIYVRHGIRLRRLARGANAAIRCTDQRSRKPLNQAEGSPQLF